MKEFRPHHSILFENIFTYNDFILAIPELCVKIKTKIDPKLNTIKTLDNKPLESDSEFVITNIKFFEWLKTTKYLSLTIYSNEQYFRDLPIMFEDEWALDINNYLTCNLGYTVNKFTEPAVFYGKFPIEIYLNNEENEIRNVEFNDISILNRWGLIDKFEDAKNIALSNSYIDPENEIWQVLLIKADINTYEKLLLLDKTNTPNTP